ncbi:MAG: diguanylate cyclase [Geobacteraceae bacterium]|nr:diguanylate cyclase [Geobacteraceae bacterium]
MDHTTRFYRNLSLMIALVIVSIYLGLYLRSSQLLLDSVKQQAASYFDLIVRVRRWNANYGGVYVEKKPSDATNPYLREVGIEPDVVALDGRIFTLRNPALMTKEISHGFSELNGIQFHITSQKLLNGENAPDPFELRALKKFEGGEREFWEIESGASGRRFRYMAPLLVEQPCLECHFKFGYKVGDIRGGISVSIPFAPIQHEMDVNRTAIIALSVLTLVILLGSTYLMFTQLLTQIKDAQHALQEASITDELTGLRNRRYLMLRYHEEFERARRLGSQLGFFMMDLDHFKGVNDSCGHPFGDLVLKSVGRAIAETVREYDIAGRYGGEEFAVIVSGMSGTDMMLLAERIRETVAALHISDLQTCICVTVSIGVAALEAEDTTEMLLKRADAALYRAKREGRNRTVLLGSLPE